MLIRQNINSQLSANKINVQTHNKRYNTPIIPQSKLLILISKIFGHFYWTQAVKMEELGLCITIPIISHKYGSKTYHENGSLLQIHLLITLGF